MVSWVAEGNTFYKKVYIGDGFINTMLMKTPESEGRTYNPFVEHLQSKRIHKNSFHDYNKKQSLI